ncbi:MAG: GAF domain-containing protein [Oscillochloris sp.]|nr:GAF domain-containing protein [Oscillochloris sp.]
MTSSVTLSNQLTSLQHQAARLREALIGCGPFFAAARHADPLPALRDLAADWLRAEELDIHIPAGTGSLQSDEPTCIAGPVIIGRRVFGRIEARRSRPFTDEDRALLTALGQIIGAVLDRSSLQSQLDQYTSQVQANADTLELLLTFGRLVVSATANPNQLALQLATQVPSMVGGERASLLLLPPDSPDSPVLALSNGSFSTPERARDVRENGLAGLVLRDRASMIIDETDTDRRWLALKMRESNSPTRCAMAVPLIWADQLLGALTVTTTETHLFDTPQLNLLELVGYHISLAIHAAYLDSRRQALSRIVAEAGEQLETALAAARQAGDADERAAALDQIAAVSTALRQAEQALATQ